MIDQFASKNILHPRAFESLHVCSESCSHMFFKLIVTSSLMLYSFLQELYSTLYFLYEKIARSLFYTYDKHRLVNSDWLVFVPDPSNIESAKGHVILIHGYLHDEGCWKRWVGDFLDNEMCVYIPRLDNFHRHSVADYTSKLRALIERDIEKPMREGSLPKASLHLVGHSMGGMIACDLVRQKPSSFATLTSLGAPLHGALWLAGILSFIHPCVMHMMATDSYGDLLCKELAKSHTKKIFFSAQWDLVVPHPSAWCEEESDSNIAVRYCGHTHLVMDRTVKQKVLDLIFHTR